MRRIFLTMLVLLSSPVFGCLMLPNGFSGKIGQSAQEALILHDGQREELVLKVDYKIQGGSPEKFAWIITVPVEPDHYALADRRIFTEMNKFSREVLAPRSRHLLAYGAPLTLTKGGSSVELGQRVEVGPYNIQPVRGVGENALKGLNRWLKKNGFPTEEPEHMKYFVENGFTFLCVKVNPSKGNTKVPSENKLAPLHLSFKTPKPYYPLRFSSMQGVFDVSLHILTQDKLSYSKSKDTLEKIRWSNTSFKKNYKLKEVERPETLRKLLKASQVKPVKSWYYNHLICEEVNTKQSISTWKSDVTFETKKSLNSWFKRAD